MGRAILGTAVILAVAGLVYFLSLRPSGARAWIPDQRVTPVAEFSGERVTVRGIRNATYRSPQDYDLAYHDATYDLGDVRTVDFVVEQLDWGGAAHTLLSFGFEDGRFLAVSVEARKEIGESYNPIRGLLRRYELIYVVGDERDLIGLRTNHRKHAVWLYPVKVVAGDARRLLVGMLEEANRLSRSPRFYNTLTSTCTTNLARHANRVNPGRVPWSWKLLLPQHAPEYAYDLGLLDTDLPFEELRRRVRIDPAARAYGEGPEFSAAIRVPRSRKAG